MSGGFRIVSDTLVMLLVHNAMHSMDCYCQISVCPSVRHMSTQTLLGELTVLPHSVAGFGVGQEGWGGKGQVRNAVRGKDRVGKGSEMKGEKEGEREERRN